MKLTRIACLLLAAWGTAVQAITVITGSHPSRLETTAAEELAKFTEQLTGKKCPAVPETRTGAISGSMIYLGDTAFARKQGLSPEKFGEEEWLLKAVNGRTLIITGGRPAGTLYGVYAFLHKQGVRFFAPDCTVVPPKPAIAFTPALDEQKQPAFAGRSVYTAIPGNLSLNQSPRKCWDQHWRWRLRILQNGGHGFVNSRLPDAEYLGDFFNLTMSFHTFSYYVSPDLFATHPEYFSMDRQGRRQKPRSFFAQGSLCVTNPEVARVALNSLRSYIQKDRQKLPRDQWPTIYDISTLDNTPYICFCPKCSALAAREGGDAGLIIHFINSIAREIRKEYPEIRIRTFCYSSARHVPRTIRPESNVLIQYCDEFASGDCYRPLRHPFNRNKMLGNLKKWHQSGAKLVFWDYWNMGDSFFNPPRIETVTDAFIDDFRTFQELDIPCLFIEGELDWITPQNFMMMNYYLASRLMIDPWTDPEPVIDEFIDGYYGPQAAPLIRDYLREIRRGIRSHKSIQRTMRVGLWSFVTPEFLFRYYRRFQAVEKALPAGSPYSKRLQREMIPLLWQIVSSEPAVFTQAGFQFSELLRDLESYCRTFAWRYSPGNSSRLEKKLQAKLEILKSKIPVPEQFAGIPAEKRRIYGYPSYRPQPHVHGNLVNDPEASCGKALRSSHPDKAYHGAGKIVLGKAGETAWAFPSARFEVSCLDLGKHRNIVINPIPQDEKYHWYRIDKAEISSKTLLWGHCWALQFELSQAYQLADGLSDNNIWDIWFEVKFTGPDWVRGSTKENAVWLDRVVLTEPAPNSRTVSAPALPPELSRISKEKLLFFQGKQLRELPELSTMLSADPDAPGGQALRSASTKPEMHGMNSPLSLRKFEVGCPDLKTQKNTFIRTVPQDEQYHWYRIRSARLSPRAYLWGHYWALQCQLGSAYRADDPAGNLRDVWFRVKYTGPAWVKGSTKENAVWMSQVILAPATE